MYNDEPNDELCVEPRDDNIGEVVCKANDDRNDDGNEKPSREPNNESIGIPRSELENDRNEKINDGPDDAPHEQRLYRSKYINVSITVDSAGGVDGNIRNWSY